MYSSILKWKRLSCSRVSRVFRIRAVNIPQPDHHFENFAFKYEHRDYLDDIMNRESGFLVLNPVSLKRAAFGDSRINSAFLAFLLIVPTLTYIALATFSLKTPPICILLKSAFSHPEWEPKMPPRFSTCFEAAFRHSQRPWHSLYKLHSSKPFRRIRLKSIITRSDASK